MMNRILSQRFLIALSLALAVAPLGVVQAADKPASQEAELMSEEKAINKEPVPNDSARVNALAKQYGVEPSVVQDLHAKQPGWGGVTIRLSMAQHLMKTDPTTYPTMNDAIAKVEATMAAEGKGYGAVAKSLGFKLGPVVSDAKHTRNDMRLEAMDKPAHPEKPAQAEKAAKPDKPPKPEKPNHPEKMPKPEKPPHP